MTIFGGECTGTRQGQKWLQHARHYTTGCVSCYTHHYTGQL